MYQFATKCAKVFFQCSRYSILPRWRLFNLRKRSQRIQRGRHCPECELVASKGVQELNVRRQMMVGPKACAEAPRLNTPRLNEFQVEILTDNTCTVSMRSANGLLSQYRVKTFSKHTTTTIIIRVGGRFHYSASPKDVPPAAQTRL